MKVLLINATSIRNIYGKVKSAAGNYFPLGLGYIASYIRARDCDVKFIDPEVQGLSISDVCNITKFYGPDLVGISCLTPSFSFSTDIAKAIRSISNAKIVIGGAHATSVPNVILKYFQEFDIAVVGEGEKTMAELCYAYSKTRYPDLSKIKGLAYRDKGNIIKTENRGWISQSELDYLPMPARDLIDMKLYKPHSTTNIAKRHAEILTSRGCPYKCIFCASHLTMGRGFRFHSADYVLNEIEYLVDTLGVKHILIQDDTFTVNKNRVFDICRGILDKQLRFEWTCWARVDTITRELLEVMKESGCIAIGFGVETGDEVVMGNIKKNITLIQCEEAFKITKKLKLKTLGFFLFGAPGETCQSIEKTIKFAIKLNPDIAIFSPLIPYPGTEIYEKYYQETEDEHLQWNNFAYFLNNEDIKIKGLADIGLRHACDSAYRRFYFRLMYIYNQFLKVKTLTELKSKIRGVLALIRQNIAYGTD